LDSGLDGSVDRSLDVAVERDGWGGLRHRGEADWG
jgi:hypothetical protein